MIEETKIEPKVEIRVWFFVHVSVMEILVFVGCLGAGVHFFTI